LNWAIPSFFQYQVSPRSGGDYLILLGPRPSSTHRHTLLNPVSNRISHHISSGNSDETVEPRPSSFFCIFIRDYQRISAIVVRRGRVHLFHGCLWPGRPQSSPHGWVYTTRA
jgi:hypothetical protein